MKYVWRNNKKYKILKHNPTSNEVQVEYTMEFAETPYLRKVKCWWDLKNCDINHGGK